MGITESFITQNLPTYPPFLVWHLTSFRAGWQQESEGKGASCGKRLGIPFPEIACLSSHLLSVAILLSGIMVAGPINKCSHIKARPFWLALFNLSHFSPGWMHYSHNVSESTKGQMKKWGKETRGCWSRYHCWEMCLSNLNAKRDHSSRAACVMLETHQECLLNVWKGICAPLSRLVSVFCQEFCYLHLTGQRQKRLLQLQNVTVLSEM